MSSQAFARKYRPQNFGAVVGQETTVQILKNALDQNRLHHAYLFNGPRGIGKTSLARIFAKALNCEKGPTKDPCNQCTSCREITEGRSLSVMEIDGASNTSVDDVRNLREKIYYLPPGGRYKIYIIDEVHMLSTAAFNALLKTLEEPPAHALFLFATTDPQKIPLTVLSRIIRFDLRPIPRSTIVTHLKKIAVAESVEAEEPALYLIAREAQGGLRDALGLFDQIVSFTGSKISLASVEEIVGVSTRRFIMDLIGAILKGDGAKTLKIAGAAFDAGAEMKRLSLDLLEYFRHLLVTQVTQDPVLFDLPEEEISDLAVQAKGVSAQDLDRLFRILQRGITELLRSSSPKILLDTLLLRLCHFDQLRSVDELVKMLSQLSSESPQLEVSPLPRAPSLAPRVENPSKSSNPLWPGFMTHLRAKKPQIYSMLSQGVVTNISESEITLRLPPKSMATTLLQDPERVSVIKDLLKEFFGRPINLHFNQENIASSAPHEETKAPQIVDDALAVFGPNTTKVERSGRETP